jgi:hypothetical protein
MIASGIKAAKAMVLSFIEAISEWDYTMKEPREEAIKDHRAGRKTLPVARVTIR